MPHVKAVHRATEGNRSSARATARVNSCHLHGSLSLSDRIGEAERLPGNSTKPRISVKPSVRPGGRARCTATPHVHRLVRKTFGKGDLGPTRLPLLLHGLVTAARDTIWSAVTSVHTNTEGPPTPHEAPEKDSRNCGILTESAGAPSSTHAPRFGPSGNATEIRNVVPPETLPGESRTMCSHTGSHRNHRMFFQPEILKKNRKEQRFSE